jgi:hypothetical protein
MWHENRKTKTVDLLPIAGIIADAARNSGIIWIRKVLGSVIGFGLEQ